MKPVTDDLARDLIREMKPIQRRFRERFGTTFVFLADEFYLRAGRPVPGRGHYGDYPQIEDGVGMVRRFIIESRKALGRDLATEFGIKRGSLHGTVATGELFYPILADFVEQVNEQCETRLKVVRIPNRFFGQEITVAGLMAGGDVLAARDSVQGEFLIVPEQACLKQGRIFLDDLSLEDLGRELGRQVAHSGPSLKSMLENANQLSSLA
jgi:NifB/MoaA-like Fe-S oxidoreductase